MGLPTHHFMFLILRSTDKKHHGSLNMRFSSRIKDKEITARVLEVKCLKFKSTIFLHYEQH